MTSTVLTMLRSLQPTFTDAERRIADTVLAAPDEVVHWSGRELARRSGTSETILFRLAGKLGLSGFREFKLAMLRDEVTEQTRAEAGIFNVPFSADSPLPVQIQAVLEAYGANLEQTAHMLVGQPLDEVADALNNAVLVTLLGMGSSLSVATLAENILVRLGIACRLSQDSHQQLLQTLHVAEKQVVLAFSYSGETRETTEALGNARRVGAVTIAISAFAASPIAKEADLFVRVPVVNPHPYRVGLVDAVLPYLMILDILAILIGSRRDVEPLREQVERTIERRKLKYRTGATRTSS